MRGAESAAGNGGTLTSAEKRTPLRFAGLVLDLDSCTLARQSGEPIALTHGELALLRVFVTQPGRVLSRDTLLSALTKRRFEPFDRSVDVLIGKLRRRIELDPKQPRLVITVRGEGYRFDGLERSEPSKRTNGIAAASERDGPPRLSIVVLPFANVGNDSDQEYFIDGITESLTTDLSRIRSSFVIGRSTAFTYKGKAVDHRRIGRELNVRYILEGSVQRSENRMRVYVQLIDAETGYHLWAERFDKSLADLFDMQDEIVARLAGALNSQLTAAEARRSELAADPNSIDLYFQGQAWLNKGVSPDNLAKARSFFDRALSADPNNIDALAGSARVDMVAGIQMLAPKSASSFVAAEGKLERALSVAPSHVRSHAILGCVYIYTGRAAEGIAECEYALALDRNYAAAHHIVGVGKMYLGRAEETEAHINYALRLSPRDTLAYLWFYAAGAAKRRLGLWEEAVVWFRRSIEANRNFPTSHFELAAALEQPGRLNDARAAVKAGLALDSSFSISRARAYWERESTDPRFLAQLERLLDGLRKAGVPET